MHGVVKTPPQKVAGHPDEKKGKKYINFHRASVGRACSLVANTHDWYALRKLSEDNATDSIDCMYAVSINQQPNSISDVNLVYDNEG